MQEEIKIKIKELKWLKLKKLEEQEKLEQQKKLEEKLNHLEKLYLHQEPKLLNLKKSIF